jgi:hypothetical protein
VKIIFLGENRDAIQDKERLLALRLREVAKCALSTEQIHGNIDGLVEGTRGINGREEI